MGINFPNHKFRGTDACEFQLHPVLVGVINTVMTEININYNENVVSYDSSNYYTVYAVHHNAH